MNIKKKLFSHQTLKFLIGHQQLNFSHLLLKVLQVDNDIIASLQNQFILWKPSFRHNLKVERLVWM